MPDLTIIAAVGIAIVGWFATIIAIKNSGLSAGYKQLLLVASWLPWIALALGAPIISGAMPLNNALGIGGALTAGLLVSTVMNIQRRDP